MIILTISQLSSNMGDVGSKTRSVGQIMEKPCEHSRQATVLIIQSSSNLVKFIEKPCVIWIFILAQNGQKLGRIVGQIIGQIMEKPCEHSRFGPSSFWFE